MATNTTAPTASLMNVKVAGRHMAVGEALQTRISEELVAAVGKYFERGGSAEVTVHKVNGHSLCVDISVVLATGQQLVAKAEAADAHTAFDAALAKVQTRIRRYKRRLTNHHNGPPKGGAEVASVVVLRAPDDGGDFDEDWAAEGSAGDSAPAAMIIAESEAPVKLQTVSMAVMELDLADCPAVLFRNAAHGGLSVVYRRADGNIGWIDPERTPAARSRGAAALGRARM